MSAAEGIVPFQSPQPEPLTTLVQPIRVGGCWISVIARKWPNPAVRHCLGGNSCTCEGDVCQVVAQGKLDIDSARAFPCSHRLAGPASA
jgi:hypothetical protein